MTTEYYILTFLQYFKDFLEQELEKYEDSLVANENTDEEDNENNKPIREVKKPSIEKISNNFYFISGPNQVFLLNSDSTLDIFAKELTSDEISDLPECILYSGQPEQFKVDHKRAFELLVSLIFNMNQMQEDGFQSFPVASFVWHLSGYLYPQIMDVQFGWVTCIVVSGAGNTCRTGKSLLTSMWQLLFDGFKSQEQGISITTAALFTKLDKGIPYYGKFFKNFCLWC